MRALKILVVAMGLLLVAGMAVLVVAVIARNNRRPAPASPPAAHATTIDLPPGAHVVGTQASGGRLVIRVGLADGGEELLVFDLASGARIAAITLQTKPATTRHDLPETPVPQR